WALVSTPCGIPPPCSPAYLTSRIVPLVLGLTLLRIKSTDSRYLEMAYLMAARPQGTDVSIRLLLEITSMGPGSSLPSSTAADWETSVAGRDSEPLFIAQ